MRGYLIVTTLFGLLCINACPQKTSGNVTQQKPAQSEPANNATSSNEKPGTVYEKGVVYAVSSEGETIKVKGFNASGNPYRWEYGELDDWIWENYDHDDADSSLTKMKHDAGETRRALHVTERGFVVPNLEALRFQLDRRKSGKPSNARPGAYTLFSSGVLTDEIKDNNQKERALLSAEYLPPIPDWLALDPPYWALQLPDKSVVFKGRLGKGWGFYPTMENLHDLDGLMVFQHTKDNTFIGQTDPGQLWCELFFPDFEAALSRHGISRESVREAGYYLQFLNLANPEKTGYYYYDGTPLSQSEIVAKPDYNSLFEMYGKHIPEMYMHQQLKGR